MPGPAVALALALFLLVLLSALWARGRGVPCGPQADEMLAAPPADGRPVGRCTTRFYTTQGRGGETRYCVRNGGRPPKCESLPIPAIVAANEEPAAARCGHVSWGFGCDRGLLCGLQQAGPNLVSSPTADKIARVLCGSRRRLSC